MNTAKAKATKPPVEPLLRTLADLKADPQNPRKIQYEALQGLKYSMASFGDLSGITWNKRTKEVVAGHQRLLGLREQFGDLQIRFDDKDQAWIDLPDDENGKKREPFKVRIVDWEKKKQQAAGIAANSQAIQGEFTDDLGPQLEELKREDEAMFAALRMDELEDSPPNAGNRIPEEVEIRAFRKTHILLSFPPDRLMEIQDHLDAIRLIDDVEVEIGSN